MLPMKVPNSNSPFTIWLTPLVLTRQELTCILAEELHDRISYDTWKGISLIVAQTPKGNWKAYFWGKADGHISDWRGCNFHYAPLDGQPLRGYDTPEEATTFALSQFQTEEQVVLAGNRKPGRFMSDDSVVTNTMRCEHAGCGRAHQADQFRDQNSTRKSLIYHPHEMIAQSSGPQRSFACSTAASGDSNIGSDIQDASSSPDAL